MCQECSISIWMAQHLMPLSFLTQLVQSITAILLTLLMDDHAMQAYMYMKARINH